jgi:lipopolysaccharide/colanic/teichoic acid biosynthesis glycosyltransferase
MKYGDARTYARFGIDLTCVALSTLIALLIRDNFDTSIFRLQALAPYAMICIVVAAAIFVVAGLPRAMWRYTSLLDILHLIAVATVALLIALAASFYFNRMENIARSLPVIQWLLLISSMAGVRIAVRLLGERASRKKRSHSEWAATSPKHVLIVGVSDVTELYLRSLGEFAQGQISVAGILSSGPRMHGRFVRMHKILGRPENVQKVVSELELHGVSVERIVVTQPFDRLSMDAREALLDIERSSSIEVNWLVESLGLVSSGASACRSRLKGAPDKDETTSPPVLRSAVLSHERYHNLKRVMDCAGVILLIFGLAPFLGVISILVALDVGLPLVFWQLRPGRYGQRFKLYKFRTMRPAHDATGNRIPDRLRSSLIGNLLRRSRLDELPQLYNILLGEMSFVGPRPLLPVDQPQFQSLRLGVRPGLTGWAQVNGGRDISPDDKAALDVWYIVNASLWLDISILMRTLIMLVAGEQVNRYALQAAYSTLEKMKTEWAVGGFLNLSSNASLSMSAGGVQEAP